MALSLSVIGCDEPSSNDSSNSSDEVLAEESSEDSDEDSAPEKESLVLGEPIEMGELEFTARSARWDGGDQFLSPDEGNRWIAIDVEIKNKSEKSTSLSSLMMFSLYDDENYSADQAIFANTKGSLDGELGAGRTMAGEVAFEVSDSSQSFEFIFEPELFGFGQAIYEISIDEVN